MRISPLLWEAGILLVWKCLVLLWERGRFIEIGEHHSKKRDGQPHLHLSKFEALNPSCCYLGSICCWGESCSVATSLLSALPLTQIIHLGAACTRNCTYSCSSIVVSLLATMLDHKLNTSGSGYTSLMSLQYSFQIAATILVILPSTKHFQDIEEEINLRKTYLFSFSFLQWLGNVWKCFHQGYGQKWFSDAHQSSHFSLFIHIGRNWAIQRKYRGAVL